MGKKIADRVLVVIDTNALVSCLLFGGQLEALRTFWQSQRVIPLLSKATFDELKRVLAYPKFKLSLQEIQAVIQLEILPYFEVVETIQSIPATCRDPHDDIFLALAKSGNAAFLITGDNDLLEIRQFHITTIIKPADFLEMSGRS